MAAEWGIGASSCCPNGNLIQAREFWENFTLSEKEKRMEKVEQASKMQQIIARARMDDAFKKRLLAEPTAVLKEAGVEIPEGVEIRILENTDKVIHLVWPDDSAQLSGDQLDKAAGGAFNKSWIENFRY